ncbi:RNA-splicing factor [Rhizina undulata]
MSSNVGLSTPRGSGTSGYVQRNLSHLKPRYDIAPYHGKDERQRIKPNQEILDHDRKREVEVKCFELRDKLEEEEVDEEEIEERVDTLRKKLLGELKKDPRKDARGLKSSYHESAAQKLVETERLRNALGISADYEEGSHWKKQEEELERRREQREQEYTKSSRD